jgi:hypothetical protein
VVETRQAASEARQRRRARAQGRTLMPPRYRVRGRPSNAFRRAIRRAVRVMELRFRENLGFDAACRSLADAEGVMADTLIKSVRSLRKDKVRAIQTWFASDALLTALLYPEYYKRSRRSWHIAMRHEKRLDEDAAYADAWFNDEIEDELWSTQGWGAVQEWRNLTAAAERNSEALAQ